MSFFARATFKSFSLRLNPFAIFLLGKEASIFLKLTLIAGGKSAITYFASSLRDSITLDVLPDPAPISKNIFFFSSSLLNKSSIFSYSYSEFKIATKYALKPASIPTVTIIGLDFALMLGNAFLVETVFVWPGMAKYGVEVILAKDLNGIVATALIITTFYLVINMVVDFVVLILNPRISLKD